MQIVRRRCQTFNNSPSKTQQEFRNDVNINEIIRRSRATGQPLPRGQKGLFGDFVGMDFMNMQNHICMAKEAFMTLPPKIRRRFHNNPGELIDFIEDNDNYEEAIQLGLIPSPQKREGQSTSSPLDVTGTSDTNSTNGVTK